MNKIQKLIPVVAALISFSFQAFAESEVGPAPVEAKLLTEQEENQITDSEDTPVSFNDISIDDKKFGTRPWRAPDYRFQSSSLGYGPDIFKAPEGLQKQVQFWIDIYAKYSTTQGVIHDAEEIDQIYEVVDFAPIERRVDLTLAMKEKMKKNLVKDAKKRALDRIVKVKSAKSAEGLSREEKKLWEKRELVEAKNIRFQLGQKDRMFRAIYISGRYIEEFEKIFEENNLPKELTRIVFVESSFNVLARSKVGASGLWQIMPSVAKPYRMISSAVDQRNHPFEATKLAARVFRSNFEMLQSWPLAITGYNHGPTGVLKMTKKYKTRAIDELVDRVQSRRSFGFASRNFYACFLAALEVEKNANRYFPQINWSQKLPAAILKTPVQISYSNLVDWFPNQVDQVQIYNPHLTRKVVLGKTKIPAKTWISVPSESFHRVLALLTRKKSEESKKRSFASEKPPKS